MRKYIHVAKALKVIIKSYFLLCLHVISYFVYILFPICLHVISYFVYILFPICLHVISYFVYILFPTLFTCYFLLCLHVICSLFLHVMHVISLLWSIQN